MRILAFAPILLFLNACASEAQNGSLPKSTYAAASNPSPEVESNAQLIIDYIDANAVTRGLNISDQRAGESDNGRARVRWTIKDINRIEVIGNDQDDADLVGWNCNSYDTAGNHLSPVPTDSFCGRFFESLLANVVSDPGGLASKLLVRAHDVHGDATWKQGDFSVETDGQFFFVRRISRQ